MDSRSIKYNMLWCTDEGNSCIYVEEGRLNRGGEVQAVFLNAPDQQFHEDNAEIHFYYCITQNLRPFLKQNKH